MNGYEERCIQLLHLELALSFLLSTGRLRPRIADGCLEQAISAIKAAMFYTREGAAL